MCFRVKCGTVFSNMRAAHDLQMFAASRFIGNAEMKFEWSSNCSEFGSFECAIENTSHICKEKRFTREKL